MDLDWLWSDFAGPVLAALFVGSLTYMAPTSRWTRYLKNDAAIVAGLPEGEERRKLAEKIEKEARRLREYREFVPPAQHAIGWSTTLATALCIWSLVSFGLPEKMGPANWLGLAMGLAIGVVAIVSMISGRTMDFKTPAQYRAEEERMEVRMGDEIASLKAHRAKRRRRQEEKKWAQIVSRGRFRP